MNTTRSNRFFAFCVVVFTVAVSGWMIYQAVGRVRMIERGEMPHDEASSWQW